MLEPDLENLLVIQRCLAGAAARLNRSKRKALLGASVSGVMLVCFSTCLFVATEILLSRYTGALLVELPWTVGCGIVACLCVVAYKVLIRSSVELPEAAERLDLAVKDHNAIAIALDLLKNAGGSCGMTTCAIEDGVAAARKFASAQPVITSPVFHVRRHLLFVSIGIIVLVTALFMPTGTQVVAKNQITSQGLPIPPAGLEMNDACGSSTSPQERVAEKRALGAAMLDRAARDPQLTAQRSDSKSAAANGTGSTDSVATGGKKVGTSSLPSPGAPPQSNRDRADPESPPHAAEQSSATVLSASESPESAKAQAAGQMPAAGASENAHPTQPQAAVQKAQQRPSQGKGRAGGVSKDGDGDSDANGNFGKPPKRDKPYTKGHGAVADDFDNQFLNQNAQGSGQNAPKKSRGVAPLMLGDRLADQLTGPQLPGPDERTKLQVPPQPTPESTAEEVRAAYIRGDETAVDVYRVLPQARHSVEQYFKQFHQDSDWPTRQSESTVLQEPNP